MRILITGSDGYIGTHLSKTLKLQGYDVLGMDLPNCILTSEIPQDIDWIIHLAAASRIGECIDDPARAYSINVTGTAKIIDHASRNKIGVIFASTSCIYDTEDTAYQSTKIQAEAVIDYYRRHCGLHATVLRFFNVYGHKAWPWPSLVMDIFLKCYRDGKDLPIYGDGSCRRNFIHLDDVASAVTACMEKRPGINLDVGSDDTVSIADLASWFGCKVKHWPSRSFDAVVREGPPNRTKEVLDWKPVRRLKDFVVDCLAHR